MGTNDNRRSPKMRRRIAQGKLKARLARQIVAAKAAKAAEVSAAAPVSVKPTVKKAKKKAAEAPPAE
jgi:hypothetical protein